MITHNISDITATALEFAKYIGSFAIGGIVFLIKEKYQNRKAIFTKRVWGQQLAFSVQSQDWGDIQILYNGVQSNNLHIISAEITNTSSKDFSDLVFEFSVPTSSVIYRHQGQLIYDDLTKDLSLQKDFNDQFERIRTSHLLQLENEQIIDNNLQKEISFVTRHRRFDIPLIQSKTNATFHFLVEDYQNKPHLNISILKQGLRLVPYQNDTERKDLKKKWTEHGGLVIFLIVAYPIYKYSNTVSLAIFLMVINLFLASTISLGLYYAFFWIKKIL
ncbi:hypothetical protein [Mucilaginibacter sp.]|uniref:hypothetical protein n=1 Tax=Mucilaginibacter sp. TaxID=1882438 RepID=UPI003AFFD316